MLSKSNSLKQNQNKMTPKTKNILLWVVAGLAGLLFIGSGITKIIGIDMQVKNIQSWGYPVCYLLPIGLINTVIGLMILIPQLRKWGAYAVYPWFVVAAYTHLQATPPQIAMISAPLFFVLLATGILYLSRNSETK